MSGIYIPGMEVPERGHTVTLTIMGGGEAVVQYYDCKPQLTVPIVYKAIPVSDHGRLVDADALLKKMEDDVPVYVGFTGRRQGPYAFRRDTEVYTSICGTPTVIPADKEAEA